MTAAHHIEVDGLTFNCRIDGGPSTAPWLIFSNSLVTDLTVWDSQVEALKRDFRILRYDQRGHGGTDVPALPPTFAQLAGDVLALADAFEIDRFSFVGLSMGVPTGLHLIAEHPERVERLVCCDGQTRTAPGGAKGWDERMAYAREHGMEAFAELMAERWFAPEFLTSPAAARVRAMIAATPLEGFAACARTLQDYHYEHVLDAIAVPTLLLVGERDGNMPVNMQRMADAIADASLVQIPDAGHIPNVENADAFTAALREFLQST